ncbi:related to beta-1,3 exoglucanase [Phialocephala subalpina]|uniref:Related to beta-1,3 exoglucanase n=1 Tax=Phialocephala subalpina TaxID=576137 RepID=A0A1L7XXN2_9HELO|nr:related to beta-1,3 exoglucanase [Phialocephala subalpina]
MLNLKISLVSSVFLSLIANASASHVAKRWTPPLPSCSSYTPYKYAGCFEDPSTPTTALIYRTDLPSGNMTVEVCTAFCKGNGYQYAGLEYYGECFCGASVNGPQVDESYCSDPCAGDTSEICGGTDYVSVYQDPTYPVENNSTISDYKPLGCYTDLTATGRTLPWQQDQVNASTITVESCLFACKDGGYAFAGVEYGSQCFCGVVLGNSTSKVDSSQCSMPCAGNSSETCGGPALLNLYVAADIESTQPCTGGTPPPPPSSSTTSSTPTPTLCTSTITVSATPTCEYTCGKWCSTPIPAFSDSKSCTTAVSACSVQVASCFLNAGFPASLQCFEFGSWCQSISNYCSGYCPGTSCSATKCKSKYPPPGYTSPSPTLSTSVYTCSPTSKTTSTTSTTTSCVPVPTTSNVCKQPNNPPKGYTSSTPVGNVSLPVLTCNNLYSDYVQNPFKLYISPDTTKCKSYKPGSGGSGSVWQGCKDACDSQYSSCTTTYAQSCKGNSGAGGLDTYSSATTKCTNQWNDCYSANSGVSGSGRCGGWNSGW